MKPTAKKRKDVIVLAKKQKDKNRSGGRKVKGENLGRIMWKDLQSLKGLNDCGRFKEEHFKSFGCEKRMYKYVWDGYAKVEKDDKGKDCFTITKAGREMLSRELDREIYAYKPQGENSRFYHDYANADRYCFHLNDDERDSYMNETQLREMREQYMAELKQTDPVKYEEYSKIDVSPVDGAYIDASGVFQAVEIVSKWYTQEMIASKMEFCSQMNITYNQYKC